MDYMSLLEFQIQVFTKHRFTKNVFPLTLFVFDIPKQCRLLKTVTTHSFIK